MTLLYYDAHFLPPPIFLSSALEESPGPVFQNVCVSVCLCICVSVCLSVTNFEASDWSKYGDVARRHETSYDIARLLLMVASRALLKSGQACKNERLNKLIDLARDERFLFSKNDPKGGPLDAFFNYWLHKTLHFF